MRGLGAQIDESKIVKKVLRTLPNKYSEKVFVIEEIEDYNTYTKD